MLRQHEPHDLGLCLRSGPHRRGLLCQWTLGQIPKHGANFDLIIGDWGDETTNQDRCAVSLAYRVFETGGQFMVIDAATRPIAISNLIGEAMARKDVIGTHLAQAAFALVDAICILDARLDEVLAA